VSGGPDQHLASVALLTGGVTRGGTEGAVESLALLSGISAIMY